MDGWMTLLGARQEMQPPFHMLLYEASENGNCILVMFESSIALRTVVDNNCWWQKAYLNIHVLWMYLVMVTIGLHSRKSRLSYGRVGRALDLGPWPVNGASPWSRLGHSPSRSPSFPSLKSEVEVGQGERLIRRALMFLSYLTFQESKKLRFQDSSSLPCPIST